MLSVFASFLSTVRNIFILELNLCKALLISEWNYRHGCGWLRGWHCKVKTQLLEELHLHLCLLQKHPVGMGQSARSLQGLWAASLGELAGSFSDQINSKLDVNFKYLFNMKLAMQPFGYFLFQHYMGVHSGFFNQKYTWETIIKNTVDFGSQRRCCCPLQNLLLCVTAEAWVAVVTDSSIRVCNGLN